MKKKLITVCTILLLLALLSACNSQESSSKKEMSGYIHENGSAEVILADEKTALAVFQKGFIQMVYLQLFAFIVGKKPIVLRLRLDFLKVCNQANRCRT